MQTWSSKWNQQLGSWTLVLVTLFTLLPGIWQIPLLDRDEPRFSRATVEMMERGEWVVPYFNGEYRFDKPPLVYWWMRLHYHLFGQAELGARFHSVIASLLVALGIYWMGRRLVGLFPAWCAAFAWLTSLQVLQHGRLALADMPMVAAVFYACWALFELTRTDSGEPVGRRWFWIFYGAMGVGFLAKGPVAIAIPLLSLGLYRWAFWRKPLHLGALRWYWGVMVVLGIIGAWGVPALIQTGGLFWQEGMGKHVIERGAIAFNQRTFVPGYYFVSVLISLFPWMAFLGVRLKYLRFEWSQPMAFLAAWSVSPFLIFTFYSTQLPHYVMPAFPALLLWLMAAAMKEGIQWGRLGNGWFWGYVLGMELILLGALVWVFGVDIQAPGLQTGIAALLFLLFCLNGLVVAVRYRAWFWVVPLVVVLAGVQFFLGGEMRRVSATLPIARILEDLPETVRVAGVGFEEPSLVFYTGRTWDFSVTEDDFIDDLRSVKGRHTCYVVLQREDKVEQMIQGAWMGQLLRPSRLANPQAREYGSGTHVIVPVSGLNFGRMRWTEVLVLFPMDPLAEQ
jgi:4-amino-4-deoxy-L-arabinose transferase-like glycosyltransferase